MKAGSKPITELEAELKEIEAEDVYSIKDIFNKMERIANIRKLIKKQHENISVS